MTNSETRDFSEYQSAGDDTPLSLVSALRRGSDRAWSQLAQIWGRTIYQFCKSRNLKHEDCEEIVQAVLVKMYRYISQFERDGKAHAAAALGVYDRSPRNCDSLRPLFGQTGFTRW